METFWTMKYSTIYNDPIRRATVFEPWCYWDDVFSNDELNKVIEYCESKELIHGTTFGEKSKEEIEKVRISNIGFHNRNPETAWIFDKVNFILQSANEMFYNFNLNGYDSFQYTTYDAEKNGNYDWHMDTILGSDLGNSWDTETRKLTMILLLNEPDVDFKGGEVQINMGNQDNARTLELPRGRIIAFPSFMIHKVKPVVAGVRKSLVVWIEGPKFI